MMLVQQSVIAVVRTRSIHLSSSIHLIYCIANRNMSSISSPSSSSLTGQKLIGQSGREYLRTAKLRSDPRIPEHSIHLAESQGQKFILKRVSDLTYKKCQLINSLYAGSKRLRLYVDENEREQTLVYEYVRGNLFTFTQNHDHSPASMAAKKEIMWQTALALEEMHGKGWMHVDLKPDNILLNWGDSKDGPTVTRAIVSDLDSALDLKGAWSVRPKEGYKHVRFGNVRWRAPEMQTGLGIGLFSDVFSYALVYIYTLIDQVALGDHDYDNMAKETGLTPEELVLGATIEIFGPVSPVFLKYIDDKNWQDKIKNLEKEVTNSSGEDPESRLKNWSVKDFPHMVPAVKDLILGMTRFAPNERLTIHQVLADPSWKMVTS